MRLRIVTYNVHKCIGGLDRRYDPARIVATVSHYQPDVVLLQEVDALAARSNNDRQVDLLGAHLGFRHRAYFPRTPIVLGGDFNDVWGTLGKKLLAPVGFRGTTATAATFPAYAPIRALDAIYVRGAVRLVHADRSRLTLARYASDHLPLLAEVELHPRLHLA